MIDLPEVAQDLEAENARLKKDLEQFQMALREQVELNKTLGDYQQGFEAGKKFAELNSEDVPTVAYLNGVAEGKKHKDALVAAAYRAAAERIYECFVDWHGEGNDEERQRAIDYSEEVYALTTADAEKALRDFGMKVARLRDKYSAMGYVDAAYQVLDEQIVDEVMKK